MSSSTFSTKSPYVTNGVLLLVNATTATAQTLEEDRVELVIDGLLPIFRTGTTQVIGYGHVDNVGKYGLSVKLFLDYSTPERLELENGEKRYLRLFLKEFAGQPIHHLELSDKRPEDGLDVAVGSPESNFL